MWKPLPIVFVFTPNNELTTMIKIRILILCMMCVGTFAWAQDEDTTEFKSMSEERYDAEERRQEERERKKRNKGEVKTISGDQYHSGGFGAVAFKSSSYQDQTLIMAGIRGGWIINRVVAMGFEGWGIIPSATLPDVYPFADVGVLGGYGGFFIEPILFSNQIVHLTFPVSGGAGWLGYQERFSNLDYNGSIVSDDVFWYVEPGVALEINVSRHFRMDFGASNRFTQDLNLLNTPKDAFDGWNYFLTLKFGGF